MQMLFLLSYQRCVFVRTPIYLFVNFHGNGSDAQTGDKILTAIGSRDRMLAHFHLVFPPHKSVAHKGNWTSFKSTARMLTFALPWACVLSYCSQRRGEGNLSLPLYPSSAAYSTCEKRQPSSLDVQFFFLRPTSQRDDRKRLLEFITTSTASHSTRKK